MKIGRPTAYSDKVADEIVAAARSGFTMEKAAELVGLEPKTVANWVSKRKSFGERIKKARREHELSLLRDIELAGAKSWQAKAWMAERVYNYAVPSARLQVAGEVQHGISGNLVAMLAGIGARKKLEQSKVIDISQKGQSQDNVYCATNVLRDKPPEKLTRPRHVRMKTRKPRAESLAKYPTTTPPTQAPAADFTRNTPPSNSATK